MMTDNINMDGKYSRLFKPSWVVMLSSKIVVDSKHSEGTFCLHLQRSRIPKRILPDVPLKHQGSTTLLLRLANQKT
jgi:hypothetical protein